MTCPHRQCSSDGGCGLQEMKQLKPGDRVLIIGASSEPYLCAKKDERALLGAFQKHICLPVPDYASRKLLWQGLVERHGAAAKYKFDWPTLAQISEGYTSGQIDLVRPLWSLSCCAVPPVAACSLAGRVSHAWPRSRAGVADHSVWKMREPACSY